MLLIKGVNKTVIEVSDTGCEIFEKVVLYVKPQYVAQNEKALKQRADAIIKKYSAEDYAFSDYQEPLSSKKPLFIICGVMLLVAIGVLVAIF